MQYFFPRQRLYFFLIVVASVGLPFVILWPARGLNAGPPPLLPLLLLGMLFALVFLVIWFVSLQRKFRRKMDILFEECDVDRFMAWYVPGLERARQSVFVKQSAWDVYVGNYAVGLSDTGDVAGAISAMQPLVARPVPKPGFMATNIADRAICSNNLAAFYLKERRIPEAKAALQDAKDLLQQCRKSPRHAIVSRQIVGNEYYILFLEGNAAAALQYFTEVLPTEKNRRGEVHTHYTLARICEKLGDEEQRLQHLAFVAENGGTLAVAKRAREVLAIPDTQAPAGLPAEG